MLDQRQYKNDNDEDLNQAEGEIKNVTISGALIPEAKLHPFSTERASSAEDMVQKDIIIDATDIFVVPESDNFDGFPKNTDAAESSELYPENSETDDKRIDCSEEIGDMTTMQTGSVSNGSLECATAVVCADKSADFANQTEVVDSCADNAAPSDSSSKQGPQHGVIKKHKGVKRLLISLVVSICVIVCAYAVGVFVFTSHYLPGTYIAGIDASIKTSDEVASELDGKVSSYKLNLSGQGIDTSLNAEDVGLGIDSNAAAERLMSMQNPWMWPVEIFETRDGEGLFTQFLSFGALSDRVTELLSVFNESATLPIDAYGKYNPESGLFEVVEEVPGSALDVDSAESLIKESVSHLDSSLLLDETVLIKPTRFSTDHALKSAVQEANKIAGTSLVLTLDDTEKATLSKDALVPWIAISENSEVELDETAINEWVANVASRCNSSGQAHTYQRADGKTITVSGGTYGRRIDSDALLMEVLDSIKKGEQKSIVIPLSRNVADGTGRNWGRYVDVDISEQHARFYDENDLLLWETDIVTGANGRHDTPTGVYTLNSKSTGVTLRGPMRDGRYEWESYVDYWMPFVGSSVGLHDATWQSAFGGTRFMDGFGSHGCVNLPRGAAASLYGIIQVGDVVVVHY